MSEVTYTLETFLRAAPNDHYTGDLNYETLRATVEALERVTREQSCGHPAVMRYRSVESGEEFCSVCRNNEMLRDALAMEAKYKADAERVTRERDEARLERDRLVAEWDRAMAEGREEQREAGREKEMRIRKACAEVATEYVQQHWGRPDFLPGEVYEAVQTIDLSTIHAAPLDATPQADRIAVLGGVLREAREALVAITTDFTPEHIDRMGSLAGGTKARAALVTIEKALGEP